MLTITKTHSYTDDTDTVVDYTTTGTVELAGDSIWDYTGLAL